MSKPVITVAPDAPIKHAAQLLVAHRVSALPVIDDSGQLVGIVSEADLLSIETRPDPRTQATPVGPTAGSTPPRVADVMTRKVVTVSTESEVSEAARLMIEAGVKRLPVLDHGRLAGIISRHDLVKVIARRDEDVQAELRRRLMDLGLELREGAVTVQDGIATVTVSGRGAPHRLAESVALTVPGVLEVRFSP